MTAADDLRFVGTQHATRSWLGVAGLFVLTGLVYLVEGDWPLCLMSVAATAAALGAALTNHILVWERRHGD